AMPSERHRRAWLIAATALLTLALWAFASSAPLAIATVAVYAWIRYKRNRQHLVSDLGAMAATCAAVTGLLAAASGPLLGQFDYIVPTAKSLIFLAHPSQVVLWHSANWQWAPYVAYLLVPPAALLTWFIAVGLRLRATPSPKLIVGGACAAILTVSV